MIATSYSTEFLGCRVSQTDQQGLRERLAASGYRETSELGEVHIVNGCCVTQEAVATTGQSIRRALRAADTVVVTDCAARLSGAGFTQIDPRVRVLDVVSERVPVAVLGSLAVRGTAILADGRVQGTVAA